MSNSQIPVVLFGHGGIGRHHFRLLQGNPAVKVLAVVDPANPPIVDVPVVKDFAEFEAGIKAGKWPMPLAAFVATPISTHYALAEMLLQQGLHVFVEKPMAPESAQAQALCALADAHQSVLMVGQSERQNPAFRAFAEQFRAGITGPVYRIECNRTGPFPQRVGDAGATIDLAVHDLDCLNYIMDNEAPQWIFAYTEQRIHPHFEDGLNAMLGYSKNILAQLTVNWLSPRKNRILNVFGYQGMLQCDFVQQKVTFFENLYQRSRPDEYGMGGIEVGQERAFPVAHWEPLAREHELFFRAVQAGMNAEDRKALFSAALAVETANRLLSFAHNGIPQEGLQ